MNRFAKPAVALGLAGALALAVASPSEARDGRNAAAIGAGVAGLAIGAMIGSAAANSHYYGYQPYGYYGGYGYAPGYATYRYAPTYGYSYAPDYGYDGYAYDSYASGNYGTVTHYNRRDPSSYYGPYRNSGWNNRERALTGSDW
jgi:hypothetical protein